jgi:acyl-coenzyme A thioesterase 9
MAEKFMVDAEALMRMPTLAPSHHILMPRTELHNALIAQPQQRNMHNRIFGGFLMRRAFELAFATAYVFGGTKPKFIEVDDISFMAPVDVGELLLYHSRILYVLPDGGDLQLDGKNPLLMVEVEAFVTSPEQVSSKLSNKFHFTFSLPDKSAESCKVVVPSNLLEGKRMAARVLADREQAGLPGFGDYKKIID